MVHPFIYYITGRLSLDLLHPFRCPNPTLFLWRLPSCLLCVLFCLFFFFSFTFHTEVRSYGICLSLSIISQGLAMLLHMAIFPPFIWLVVFHCVCMYRVFFIYSSINGHLGWFHILVIVNFAAVNIGLCISFQISFSIFFRLISRNRISGPYGSSHFNFLRNNPQTVFHSGSTILFFPHLLCF